MYIILYYSFVLTHRNIIIIVSLRDSCKQTRFSPFRNKKYYSLITHYIIIIIRVDLYNIIILSAVISFGLIIKKRYYIRAGHVHQTTPRSPHKSPTPARPRAPVDISSLTLTFDVIGLRDQQVLESVGPAERRLQRSLVHGVPEHEPGTPGTHGRRRLRRLDRVLRQVAERLLLLLRQVAGQHGGRRPRVAAADDVVVRGRRGVVRGREPEVPAPELG